MTDWLTLTARVLAVILVSRQLLRWLRRSGTPSRVSASWLENLKIEEGKAGWIDGPRWRFPKEIE